MTSLTALAHIILHHPSPKDGPQPGLRHYCATQLVLFSQHRHWFILIDTGQSRRHIETLAWVYESVAFLGVWHGLSLAPHHAYLAHDGLTSALSLYGYWILKTWGAYYHFMLILSSCKREHILFINCIYTCWRLTVCDRLAR